VGIHLNLAILLQELAAKHKLAGRVVMLGEQTLDFDPKEFAGDATTAENTTRSAAGRLFRYLGFSDAQSIDIDDSEGADTLLDLNNDETPQALLGQFDLVLNGGTLEHVFHVPNALAHITRLLRPDGVAVHVLPCNNWVEHGFYQFSPTLMSDYYDAAGFTCLESALIRYLPASSGHWTVCCAWPGQLGQGLAGALDGAVYLHLFAARRGPKVEIHPRPRQRLYAGPESGTDHGHCPRWFEPFILDRGRRSEVVPLARWHLDSRQIRQEQGCCWIMPLTDLAAYADTTGLPARSSLILLENGIPLGPAHSPHSLIRERGAGRYSHWGDALYFAASDNSPPDRNGRDYTMLLYGPEPS
jgi:SAM-dependent methyltransferase